MTNRTINGAGEGEGEMKRADRVLTNRAGNSKMNRADRAIRCRSDFMNLTRLTQTIFRTDKTMRAIRLTSIVSMLLMVTACAPQTQPPRVSAENLKTRPMTAPISNTDACAMQMHDICGGFLLFYAAQNRLPTQLGEMYSSGVLAKETRYVCPVSQQPYIYNPAGILLPEQNARVILYDAASSHSGFRWAISIHDPQPGQPMIAKVIALQDQFFLLQR